MSEARVFYLLADTQEMDPRPMFTAALRACGADDATLVAATPTVGSRQDIAAAYQAAHDANAGVAHALVNSQLRQAALFFARHFNVPSVDLLGAAILRLADILELSPTNRPDLFQPIGEDYFRRIEAIEFAVAHDDGLRAHELDRAEIVLTGVSRTSKTPLSMYLASHGWLVANVPLVANTEPPPQLFLADPTRVFALTIEAERLALLRRVRLTRLGMSAPTDYAELDYIREELRHARDIFRRGGWGMIDVTSKSIEESASEIIQLRRERTGAAR